ncbi:MAG: FecR domain-containing protein [Myxococcales bacterium]
MAGSLKPLEALGRHVATTLDAAAPERERALDEARRSFLLAELGEPRQPRSFFASRAVWASGFAVAVAAAAAVFVLNARHSALTFEVDGVPGVAKTWLAAPHTVPMQLHFSEGTNVRLEPDSKLRIVELSEPGASLSLESGHVHCEVVHRASSAWKVVAGPFTVRVTGTVFDVNWDPNSEQLSVSVTQGSVVVHGANGDSERVVRASETLSTSAPEHRSEQPSSELTLPSAAPALDAAATAAPAGSTADEPSTPPSSRDEAPAAWRVLAKRGALREAFASADATGFTGICAIASPGELLMLGDGARLSGKPDRATEALLALRHRFPGDSRRGAAAFALGKVAFDQRRAYEQAAEWFATSLREQPGGPLAREAEGRLIEALRSADDSAGARRTARDYLSRYPEGPHADLARSVLH